PRAGSWLDVGNYIHGPAWIPLLTKPPYPAEYTYRLFLPFAATLRQPGTYTITAREDLQFYKYPDPKRDDSKKTGGYTTAAASIPIEATAKVVVGQPDDKKMGVLIDDLVKQATPLTTRDAANAYMALQSIPDERVVPYFLQSLQSDNGNLKIDALRVLSEFNNDAALGGLKDGMAPASPNVTNLSQGTTFRIIAAIGLLNSPHLDAIPTLLTYRHDPDPGVREIVVEAIATRLSPEKASPLLQEMSGDKNKDVSDAAKKGLAKLVKKS
ncbi:MAG TPA: HEAT repeat domain-containing protein, partial [Chthoniobacteraceae bacterium]|nr:HEAT repeat domain-containing protein [Chthoniobacteraceae bacterium]